MKNKTINLENVTIGAVIDHLYEVREQRLNINKQVEALKSEERKITNVIQERLLSSDLEGAKGKIATASRSIATVAHVTDWQEVHNFIRETGHFQLLTKRVLAPAYNELLSLGISVPGAEPQEIAKLSLTKAKR